jgi:hypothetical protein
MVLLKAYKGSLELAYDLPPGPLGVLGSVFSAHTKARAKQDPGEGEEG